MYMYTGNFSGEKLTFMNVLTIHNSMEKFMSYLKLCISDNFTAITYVAIIVYIRAETNSNCLGMYVFAWLH